MRAHQPNITAIVTRLLSWFSENARDLPWRRTAEPYQVFVSEIMLQQTQVSTVIPYYERWMTALPDLAAVAKAPPEKLYKLWEGLGYYTRVRNLQKAAQIIMTEHAGRFPENYVEVLALPGVGRYTAGAICSIAFGQPTPILDGNVVRVLSRLHGVEGNPRDKKVTEVLWRQAGVLVSAAAHMSSRAFEMKSAAPRWLRRTPPCSLLNQSLMELGALVCKAAKPDCVICPVRACCTAFRADRVDALPAPVKRPKPTRLRIAAFIVEDEGRYLVRQRPARTVNGALWEFPNLEVRGRARIDEVARRALGHSPLCLDHRFSIRHSITRYRVRTDVYVSKLQANELSRFDPERDRWATPADLQALPFPSAHRKIIRHLVPSSGTATE